MTFEVAFKPLGVAALAVIAASCGEPGVPELDRRTLADVERSNAASRAPVSVWGGEQKLVAGDSAEFDQLGYSVSLAGDDALIGAYGADRYRGGAYVFTRSGRSFGEEQQLVASDGAKDDAFGWSVSLGDDRALLGAYGSDAYRGAVYVFVRSGSTWTEEDKLLASDGASGDQFGFSVALSGDRALIGAVGNDGARGAVYLFVRSGSVWTEAQKLVASDGEVDDKLGYAVSLSDERAIVGAVSSDASRGAAYVFVDGGTSYTEEQKLVASDGVADDHFGVAVSLAADRAMVGAYWDDSLRGAVYAFARSGSTWNEGQKLLASDGADGHRFGNAVSLGEGRVIVGEFARGAAYVFVESGGSWTEQQRLVASDGASSNLFGWSVSLGSERALIGAHYDDNLRGAAYVYSFGLADGEPCSVDGECANERCVDEHCCNTDCTGGCGACSVAEGADNDGICSVFPSGSVGSPNCGTLSCNGESPECAPCAADSDCPETLHCTDGECTNDGAPLGTRCASDEECASRYCIDGVCCDTRCDNTCEGCTAALKGDGEDGTCDYVAPGLNPPRSRSDPTRDCEEDSACPSCDGQGRCECGPSCESDVDCPAGERCAAQGECVKASAGSAPGEDPGCGCRAFGGAEHGRSAWLVATLALLLFYRARA